MHIILTFLLLEDTAAGISSIMHERWILVGIDVVIAVALVHLIVLRITGR